MKPPKTSKFVRPESLNDMPETDSTSGSDDPDLRLSKGLTSATQQLGNGAALYLQTMKALAIMFVLLTVINIPVLIIYADNTSNNNYAHLSEAFKYLTLGNLGQTDDACGHSSINIPDLNGNFYPDSASKGLINLTCSDNFYIDGVKNFGFLYRMDRETKNISSGRSWCEHVMKPFDKRLIIEPEKRE